eukprot:jgi/Tetstr1/449834/TSEL_036897.t1
MDIDDTAGSDRGMAQSPLRSPFTKDRADGDEERAERGLTVDDVMGVGEDPVGEDGMDIDAPAWPPAGVEPAMRA